MLRESADEPAGEGLLDRAVVDLADQRDETNLGEHHAQDEYCEIHDLSFLLSLRRIDRGRRSR